MWISAETLSRAFHRKAAERDGDEETARAVGGGPERRRSNQINKLSTEDLHGKSKQDVIDHLKRKYDSNNDGIFQDEEVDDMLLDTIELCEMKEGLEVEKSVMFNKLRKMNRRMKLMGGTGLVVIIASVIGTYYGSESTFSQGTLEVKESISKSQVTSVGLDDSGHSHLKDIQTGLDVSTRSVGDSFFSRTVIDPRSGRKLKCIDLRFVAELYHDSVARTEASVVLVNEDGVEEQVVPINGQFVDSGRTLTFGRGDDSVTMIMDSDVCNNGADGMLQGEEVAYELDVDAAAQDAKEVEGNESDSLPSPFERHLLRLPQDVDDPLVADPSARVQVVDKSASRSHKSVRQLDTSKILQRNRDEYFHHRDAIANGRALTTSGSVQMCTDDCEEDSPVVQVDDSGSFVGWLPCTESYVDGSNIGENAVDFVFAPLEASPLNTLESDGGSVNLVSIMKNELNDAISDAIGFNVLLPQKVCADSEEDVATRGGGAGVEACESLDMLGDTDVLAFGYYNAGWDKGICVALNDGTHTYALGQSGILPPIKIHALEINILAIAISITKQLTATTLNEMWDGSDDEDGLALLEELTIPGHFVMRGTGDFGLTLSSEVELALSIDATLLIDLDYANDGVAPEENGAVDFAMMFSGQMTPTFEIDVGKVDEDGENEPMELDFSAVFQVDADFYMYVNKDYKHVQLAVSRNLNLAEICDVNAAFDVFCVIFEQASFSMAMRAYANNDGFGAQFAISATMEMKNGFDIMEDLIGWPADNQVDLALDIALMGKRLRTCVMFEKARFCTGKCSNDSECDEDEACDNVFKVCRKKRANGGTCGRDAGCISDNCVSGFCRECPTAGSTTDCTVADGHPANYFCQRTYELQTHVCRPQKNNGDASGCSGDGACLSGICIGTPKICRACRNPGSVDTCENGNVCQKNAIGAPTCGPKKSNGDASGCISNDVCKSGVCLNGYCRACRTVGSTTGCSNGEVCQNNSAGVNICAPKKSDGQTCVNDGICKSGVCLNKFCRACRTVGSTTGCSNGEVCQNNSAGVNICAPKKSDGQTCVNDGICKSGVCLNKFCRACRTVGSTSGCTGGNVCQNNSVGANVCGAKKSNGQTCVNDGICKSGNCLAKYCRVCATDTHCKSQYDESYKCFDNIKTGFIKKCCQSYCKGKGIFKTCGHLRDCKS